MNIAFMNQDIQMEEHIKKANCVHMNMSQQIKQKDKHLNCENEHLNLLRLKND